VFADLLAEPGVTEVVELRSTFGFMAFHGGSLEEVTDTVAVAAAERAGASVYAVIQPPGLRWHIPSRMVRPEASAGLAGFVAHVQVVVAVHGYGRDGMWTTLLLGGGNRALAAHVAAALRPALPDYEIVDDLTLIPAPLRGVHPQNPVNAPRGAGVQLELPPRVRGRGRFWRDHDGPELKPHTEALIGGLAAAARSWGAADGAGAGAGAG
jgi:phage replication-related protein YjqB (UPF0714/DUF867 family)